MAHRKNKNKVKSGQSPQDNGREKKETLLGNSPQKDDDVVDNEEDTSDLQSAALLSALDMETRREIGQEEFDEDAEEEDDDDD